MAKALIIVDMLNDFIKPDGALYIGPTGDAVIEPILKRLEDAYMTGDLVIFLRDAHEEDDLEFARFPKHAVKNTPGAQIISEYSVRPGSYVIDKTRYSGFYNTNLAAVLRQGDITEATVVGVCTSICIHDTVGGLANRDIAVTIPKDCVADFDQEAHAAALKRMEALYGASLV
jgi:nicotinamidase-related amidase